MDSGSCDPPGDHSESNIDIHMGNEDLSNIALPPITGALESTRSHDNDFNGTNKVEDLKEVSNSPERNLSSGKNSSLQSPKRNLNSGKTSRSQSPEKNLSSGKTSRSQSPERNLNSGKTSRSQSLEKNLSSGKTSCSQSPERNLSSGKTSRSQSHERNLSSGRTSRSQSPERNLSSGKTSRSQSPERTQSSGRTSRSQSPESRTDSSQFNSSDENDDNDQSQSDSLDKNDRYKPECAHLFSNGHIRNSNEGDDSDSSSSSEEIQQYDYNDGRLTSESEMSDNNDSNISSKTDNNEYDIDDRLARSFRYYKPGEVDKNQTKTDNLRVFQVLDECNESEDDDQSVNDSESDISTDEVDDMLEESLKNVLPKGRNGKDIPPDENGIRYTNHNTYVIEELGYNHFDMLPEGWIKVIHKSGMPIYLHKNSRVCTFSRPYYLGQGSVRKHNAPLNAIPCLQYRRALEEEEKRKQAEKEADNLIDGQQYLQNAKIETTEENKLSQSLNPLVIQQYCRSLFRFKKEERLRFVSWTDRRKYAKAKKTEKEHHRPSFPDGTKLIKFPIHNPGDGPRSKPRGEWIMNPNGKSYICILHEYVQHALKKQPTYEFKALEHPSTPYSATVIIDDMRYGYGTGTSKKQAKFAAAKASLEILIPDMRDKIRSDSKSGKRSASTYFPDEEESSLSIFDEIKIEDARVAEFCAKTTEPSPYSILLTCLQRNFGLKEMPIEYKVNPLHRQSNEFIMNVGKHTARVVCKNKKEGKQRASQAILQVLHPHISSWGALLRLYGNRSARNVKEIKQEEQEITMLQSKASLNSPNYSIINKLRSEMEKLHSEQMKVTPIGVFIPPEEVNLPSSGTELDKVDI